MQTDTPSGSASSFTRLIALIGKHQQTLKWLVYSLLILNFGYYLFDDWRNAEATLLEGATLLQIMSTYATSIDEMAWFIILGLLEFETYWMEDDEAGFSYWAMQIIRIGCYGLLGHTLFAYSMSLVDLGDAQIIAGVTNVCEFAGQDLFIVRNLLYDPIEIGSCAALSDGTTFYRLVDEPVVADAAGYTLAVQHAWIDVIDIVCWISISLAMTFIVVLQDRKIYRSMWIMGADRLQYICYSVLVCEAVYWLVYGFYVYTWDTLLWIGGFAAIDANLAEWRHELEDENVSVQQAK